MLCDYEQVEVLLAVPIMIHASGGTRPVPLLILLCRVLDLSHQHRTHMNLGVATWKLRRRVVQMGQGVISTACAGNGGGYRGDCAGPTPCTSLRIEGEIWTGGISFTLLFDLSYLGSRPGANHIRQALGHQYPTRQAAPRREHVPL